MLLGGNFAWTAIFDSIPKSDKNERSVAGVTVPE